MKLAKVPNEEASETIPFLISEGIADPGAKICKGTDARFVPICEGREPDVIRMGLMIIDGEAFKRGTKSPQNRITERLAHLPDGVRKELPMRWEFIGDVVILRLHDNAAPYRTEIGEAYAKELNSRTVCADIGGVSGEFRQPATEILYGNNAESVRLENGIRYKLDATKVMFASGNTDERHRMRELDCKNETVVDMFAGIGYFALPIAKFTGAKKVIACEKNPDSFHYLCENIRINDVEDIVTPILGDNRDLKIEGADRVIMGYVQRTSEFLEKAKEMIRSGGTIHYHDTFYVTEYRKRTDEILSHVFGHAGYKISEIREVKSFAPSVSHYVVDVIVL
ncbi:MAG: class I SAM-dependent methyltransferase family protein [Methanomassiliicoccaceae archaeon]|jgi:tRNA wybutosine-synthesizing protein 2|nr:class I SAM-dependent methyltransferase family protein [Methanomassiliicoccaceae archaeon]